jgi:two-component system, OmpR family, phosphate regulon response regulator PhoB
MGGTVLLIHGETAVRRSANEALQAAGYVVEESDHFALTEAGQPDVILISSDAIDPFEEYLPRMRNHAPTRSSRIVVMARHDALGNAAQTLEYGADDCIGVPFSPEELTARINACLRRPVATLSSELLTAGPLLLDAAVHRVVVAGQAIELAPTEFRLMAFFLENQGRVFSRGELLRRAWSKNIQAGRRTVDVHVRRLRQQLEPFGCEGMIQTVRGFGYRFAVEEASVQRVSVKSAVASIRRT